MIRANSREYLGLLGTACLIGIPVSLVAFGFLAALHEAEHAVWVHMPEALGYESPPWWWPIPSLAIAGVLVGSAIRFLPGVGGHVPIDGLGTTPVAPRHLPSIVCAAFAGLSLGVVLGPEAPLIALGSALPLILAYPLGVRTESQAARVLAVAGATAAVAAIFGSPLVAAVFILEAAGLAGPQMARLILPCLLSSGVGALLFTGLGQTTGLETASLGLPDLSGPPRPDVPDLLWTIPLAVVVAVVVRGTHVVGAWVAGRAATSPLRMAVVACSMIAICASAYSLLTDRSPYEVASSGQSTLGELVGNADDWTTTALVLVLVLKGLAYGVALGALRGGPVFPAVFLGAAAGVLVADLPGYGLVPALAAGMAAATAAVLPLPVSAAVLVVLLLGPNAAAMTPIVLISVVVASITEKVLSDTSPPQAPTAAPS